MRDVIADWFPPLTPDDGYENPIGPVDFPAALREWYQLCGKRPDIWSQQDEWRRPWETRVNEGYLAIVCENQGCAFWGIPIAELTADDPPVFVELSAGGKWVLENTAMSEFALQMLAYNMKWASRICCANGSADESAIEFIRETYPRLPFPDWHWPCYPTRFYGTKDVIVETNGRASDVWLWVSARTEDAYRDFMNLVGAARIQWEATKSSI